MPRGRFRTAALVLVCCVPHAYAQDTRNVSEPRIPQPCTTLTASLQSSGGKLANADEGKLDTPRIAAALDSCGPGKAVQLKAAPGQDSFLSGPLQLRAGGTLLVDGGGNCGVRPLEPQIPKSRIWGSSGLTPQLPSVPGMQCAVRNLSCEN